MTVKGRILYVVGFDETEPAVSWQVAELSKAWQSPVVLLGVRRAHWLPFLKKDDRRALKRATVDVAKRIRGLRGHVGGIKVAVGDPVIEAGRQFKVLAENKLEAGFMASPAIAGKALFVRSKTHLYRLEK